MQSLDLFPFILVIAGAATMTMLLLKGIGDMAVAQAFVTVAERRTLEEQRRADNAAAEAAGKAAMLEPLALNADGTIEEPIIGVVESR